MYVASEASRVLGTLVSLRPPPAHAIPAHPASCPHFLAPAAFPAGFPCNQFGAQESGTEEEIEKFTCDRFKVSFPLTAKVEVNGAGAHPLWQHLKKAKPGILGTEGIKWNFTKMLVNKEGQVVERYAPTTTPEAIAKDIEKLL